MLNEIEQERLLSHVVTPNNLENTMQQVADRIKSQGEKPYVTVERQLDLLSQLSQFDFGRYLLQHRGVNGYWTHYMLTYPWFGKKTGKNNRGEPFSELEHFMLNRAPTMLATQQRFEIFLKENQKKVKDNAVLSSIPCGMIGELFYLNYENINSIQLIGIDYDRHTLDDAKILAEQKKLLSFVELIPSDAWNLNLQDELDLISSNGLNIYESDDNKVTELFRQFYKALKPDGKLVTSFLTYPPTLTTQCEWNMANINSNDLFLQKIIFVDIIEAKWQCYSSSDKIYKQLESIGFEKIEFIYDSAKMFPTVIAYKNK